jgi:hypothetical protein
MSPNIPDPSRKFQEKEDNKRSFGTPLTLASAVNDRL